MRPKIIARLEAVKRMIGSVPEGLEITGGAVKMTDDGVMRRLRELKELIERDAKDLKFSARYARNEKIMPDVLMSHTEGKLALPEQYWKALEGR